MVAQIGVEFLQDYRISGLQDLNVNPGILQSCKKRLLKEVESVARHDKLKRIGHLVAQIGVAGACYLSVAHVESDYRLPPFPTEQIVVAWVTERS